MLLLEQRGAQSRLKHSPSNVEVISTLGRQEGGVKSRCLWPSEWYIVPRE